MCNNAGFKLFQQNDPIAIIWLLLSNFAKKIATLKKI